MALDYRLEQELSLSTQDIYDICDFAAQAAYDDGFMNSFIFNRALFVFTAIVLFQEDDELAEKLKTLAARNINEAWSYLLDEDIIEIMNTDYTSECNFVADCGKIWFDEYTAYAHSARGLLNTVQTMTGNVVSTAAQQFKDATADSDIQDVLQLADQWGMNNAMPHDESLFKAE